MQQLSVALAAALRSLPQEPNRRDGLRDRARCSRRQELLANLRALRALAQRARLRKRCKLALHHRTKPSARVLTIFTILALARQTSSPDHLHRSRLRTPDILAFIASTAAATISSARTTSASSFTHARSTVSTSAASIVAAVTATIAAIIPAGAGAAGAAPPVSIDPPPLPEGAVGWCACPPCPLPVYPGEGHFCDLCWPVACGCSCACQCHCDDDHLAVAMTAAALTAATAPPRTVTATPLARHHCRRSGAAPLPACPPIPAHAAIDAALSPAAALAPGVRGGFLYKLGVVSYTIRILVYPACILHVS